MDTLYWTTFVIIAFASVGYGGDGRTSPASGEVEKTHTVAIHTIEQALEEEVSGANVDAQIERLRNAASEVLTLTKQNHEVQAMLAQALDQSQQQPSPEFAKQLRGALMHAQEILAFQAVMEAPLPEGFPHWTPVGEIRVKRYPNYRLAQVTMSEGEESAFWTLFKHIESNKIAMTAPVEMSYSVNGSDNPRGIAMAFLYADPSIGQTGSAGKVSVVDVPAATAVSIGVRGEVDSKAVAAAHSRLMAWLTDHVDEFEAAGELRVLGYNSPMIPIEKRYFEVQVPVRQVTKGE